MKGRVIASEDGVDAEVEDDECEISRLDGTVLRDGKFGSKWGGIANIYGPLGSPNGIKIQG